MYKKGGSMKKVLAVLAVALVALPGITMAKGGNHPMAGCGLGYVLFGNGDNSKIMQILAATTNGTCGNQTFGMTTGTSGCTEDGAVKMVKEAEVFAEVNLDSLRREMAIGQGEYVNAFASLLGAKGTQIPALVKMFQNEYGTLFPSANTTSGEMLASLSSILNS
jgi:hypothetical protein